MAYRYGQRDQIELFPQSIEDYVNQDDPVRAYDAFVESLNFNELGIEIDENKVGNSEYSPKSMLKLLIYGYSYGIRSSRKLERALYHNISFIWLMCGLKPDHKTIANFRKNNKKAIKNVLNQCVRFCLKFDLIEGNTLFVDGSKIRANASIKNTWTKEKCQQSLKEIDKRIEAIFRECEEADEKEQNQSSFVKLKERLNSQKTLKDKVNNIMKELDREKQKSQNTTDKECTRINSLQGSNAGYNSQIVTDEKHGLIVNTDVVSENNDLNQFASQVNQANETLGKKCKAASADSGYANTDELKKIYDQGINVIVPSQRQASKKEPKEFDKEHFKYDPKNDSYTCPEGHVLQYNYTREQDRCKEYSMPDKFICKQCRHFGICTRSDSGRSINRLINEETRLKLEAQYSKLESQAVYNLRKQKVELPFGHIKRNLGVQAFLLKGLDGVKAEMTILASNFNITRMVNILGVGVLIDKLKAAKEGEIPLLEREIAV